VDKMLSIHEIEEIVYDMINTVMTDFTDSPKDFFESLNWESVPKDTFDMLVCETDFDSIDAKRMVQTVRESIDKGKYETVSDIVHDDEIREQALNLVCACILKTLRGE